MNILKKMFYIVFGLIFLYLLFNIPFNSISTLIQINSLYFVPISIIVLLLWFLIWKLLNKFLDNKTKKTKLIISGILFLIIFIIEYLILKNYIIPFGWDFEYVVKVALDHANNHLAPIHSSMPNYFQHFPNNLPLYSLLVIIFKFSSLIHIKQLLFVRIINAGIIYSSVIFTYLYLNKKRNTNTAIYSLIIYLFFIPLFLYIPVIYTDTFSVLFAPLILYTSTFIDDNNKRKRILAYILLAIFTYIGSKLKMTVIFITLSILIYKLLSKEYKATICILIGLLTMFIGVNSVYNYVVFDKDILHIKYDEYGKIPYTHWIMMGIDNPNEKEFKNSYGGYSEEDYNYSLSFKNESETKQKNIEEIKNRISSYGILGYLEYLTKKAVNCWGDGNYFSAIVVHWASKYNMKDVLMFISGKEDNHIMIYINGGVQFTFLLLLCINFFNNIKNKKDNNIVELLSLSMLLLFLLLWENRSRYLYNYIPIFVIIVSTNMDMLRFKRRLKNEKK